MVTNELISHLVQFEGAHPRFDMSSQFAKRFTNKLVRLAHQLNFVFSLQEYLHRRLVRSHAAAMYATRTEQAVIVAHEQMTLNLGKRVEHDTHENQQRGTTEEL